LDKRAEKLLLSLEEKLKFYSSLGIDFIPKIPSEPAVEERIRQCRKCPLGSGRINAVPGEGSKNAALLFVGEGPGAEEDAQGRPFVGRAGQLLTRIITKMGLKREEVYITNVVKCRPPKNRAPNGEEIEQCREYLLEQIDLIRPKVIVTLGRVAASFFISSNLGMTALRGDFYEFEQIKVMPTFHPSYLVRNERNKDLRWQVWEDMQKVMAELGMR
jgi:DNA polymerase